MTDTTQPFDAGALREALDAMRAYDGPSLPMKAALLVIDLENAAEAALAAAREPVAPAEAEPPGLRAAAQAYVDAHMTSTSMSRFAQLEAALRAALAAARRDPEPVAGPPYVDPSQGEYRDPEPLHPDFGPAGEPIGPAHSEPVASDGYDENVALDAIFGAEPVASADAVRCIAFLRSVVLSGEQLSNSDVEYVERTLAAIRGTEAVDVERLRRLQDWLIHPDRAYSPHEIATFAYDEIAAAFGSRLTSAESEPS